MVNIVYLIIAGFIGYLFGSIPFGYIYVKAKTGQILTEVGSGRTGGTNSLRAAGKGVGVLTSLRCCQRVYGTLANPAFIHQCA